MGASAGERVRIYLPGQVVEISREERDGLLEELCFEAGCKEIRERLEAVSATWSLVLDDKQRSRLREALARREGEVALPEGLERLLVALELQTPAVGISQR